MSSPMTGVTIGTNPGSSPNDVQRNLGNIEDNHVEGYPRLAYFFAECPRYLHLRRFSALAVRMLLYQQHELTVIEAKLLQLEQEDAHRTEHLKDRPSRDYTILKKTEISKEPVKGETKEQKGLYEQLKIELKEYEDALLRFDQLASRGYDVKNLHTVQCFLSPPKGERLLRGPDAAIWGMSYPQRDHASDIIQIVRQTKLSILGNLLRNTLLSWSSRIPDWLYLLSFWSKRPDPARGFKAFQYSHQTFEVVSVALGNFVTSVTVYAAVTLLYFAGGRITEVVTVILVALAVTVCSVLFHNHQFISMLATILAVLVALLLGDGTSDHTSRLTCA